MLVLQYLSSAGNLTSTKLQDANEYHILQGWDHTRLVSYNKSSNYREPGKQMQLLRFYM